MKIGGRNRFFLLVFLIFVLIFNKGMKAKAASLDEVVKVGCYCKDTEKSEGVCGFNNEYYQKLAEVTGLNFEYVQNSFNESLKLLEEGKIDVVAGVAYTPKRARSCTYIMNPMSFSTVSILEKDKTKKYYYEETKNVKVKKAKDFVGKKIGIEGKYKEYYLKLLKRKGIDTSKIYLSSYSNYDLMKQDLLEDKLDYVISFTTLCNIDGLNEVKRLKTINLYFSVNRKNKRAIEKINDGIQIIKKSNPNYNEQLYHKYFGEKANNLYYTASEKIALNNLNELIFYVPDDKPLVYHQRKDGKETGYYSYYIKELASMLRKKYKIIPVSQKVLSESKLPGFYLPVSKNRINGNSDFFKKFYKTDLKYLTNTIREKEKLVCVNKGVTEISDDAIYASTNKSFCGAVMKNGHRAIPVKNDFEGLKLLSEGKVDVATVDIMLTNYVNDLIKYKNIVVLDFTKPVDEAMVAINGMDDNVFLAINKTIKLMPEKNSKMFMVNVNNSYSYRPNLIEIMKNRAEIFFLLGLLLLIIILMIIKLLVKKNEEIIKLAKASREAKKDKTSFLSKISHEMRTPLNAIISFANFGIEEKRNPIYVDYFRKIKFSSDTLLVLMQDVLQLEEKNYKEYESKPEIVKIVSIKNKIESIISPLAATKNIEFRILFDNDIEYIKTDIKAAQQIIINILTNAIKYTRPGGQVIWNVKVKKSENKAIITHIVSDNGVGISEKFQRQMFEPFTMETNELSKTEIGTGLGLAICKNNIEKLNGKMSCESKLGEGTKFTISFETVIVSEKEIKEYEEKMKKFTDLKDVNIASFKQSLKRPLRILLCEDVDINAEITIKILTENNMKVDWVKNGQEGVKKAFENKYDIILMDIRMPLMDGLLATKEIRKNDKKVIIIALSANVYESDKQKSFEAGMNEHLGKPINKKELLRTIYRFTDKDQIEI